MRERESLDEELEVLSLELRRLPVLVAMVAPLAPLAGAGSELGYGGCPHPQHGTRPPSAGFRLALSARHDAHSDSAASISFSSASVDTSDRSARPQRPYQ